LLVLFLIKFNIGTIATKKKTAPITITVIPTKTLSGLVVQIKNPTPEIINPKHIKSNATIQDGASVLPSNIIELLEHSL